MALDDDLRRLALGVVMGCFEGTDLPGWVARDLTDGLGSLCLFGSNLTGSDEQVRDLTARVHEQGPRCLVALDEEGGDVTRLDHTTGARSVGAAVLGASGDPTLTRATTRDLGLRLARVGVDLDLAPVLDVNSAADNPVIGTRSYGADPGLVAEHGVAAVRGLAEAGVAACLKHFPGHGDTVTDSHVAAPVVRAHAGRLRERELVPFAAAVAAGAEAVMTAHVRVPAVDPHQPASTSTSVTALLRDDLGFDGVLVTDALDMAGVSGPDAHGSVEVAAVAALLAGADLLCLGADWPRERVHAVVDAVVDAVGLGVLPHERLAEAADRVRRLGERCAARREASAGSDPVDEPGDGPVVRVDRAARAALRVQGHVPPLAGALVVRLVTGSNAAVADVPWGLEVAGRLAELLDGIDGVDTDPSGAVEPLGADRPLVVVARDTHRDATVRSWLERAVAARPDLVLVDLGWPSPDTPLPAEGALVHTHGASPASTRAVAELLAQRSAVRS